jgi:hypothetical protein
MQGALVLCGLETVGPQAGVAGKVLTRPDSALFVAVVAALAFTVAAAEVTAFMTIDTDRPRRDLLSVRVTYCHPLRVPLVPALLVPLLRRLDPQLPHQRCYAASRVPLIARAVVPLPRLAGPAGPDGSAGP